MATENILINFEVDYTELTNAQKQLEKTGKIDAKGFNDIQAAINTTATDTKGLIRQFKDVAGASIKMGKTLEDAFGSGVKDALDQAGVSVDEFAEALKKTTAPAITVKKELALLKSEMARMKAEGKDTGKEFEALRAKAGKLADAVADANAEIKNAGSDTRGIDNVIGSISALAGGYAAVQGAAALFGEENEDLQKALLKVNAAMAIAQGVQQVSNALQKEGALLKLRDSIATGAQSAAQRIYAAAVGTSTGAMKAFKIALLATGIGAVVFLLFQAAKAMGLFGDETETTNDEAVELATNIKNINIQLEDNISALRKAGKLQAEILKQRGSSETALHNQSVSFIKQENDLLLKAAKEKVRLLGFENEVRTKQDAENLLAIKKFQAEAGTASKKQQARLDEEVKAVEEVVDAYKKVSQNIDDIDIKQAEFTTKRAEQNRAALKKAADDLKAANDKLLKEEEAYLEKVRLAKAADNRAAEKSSIDIDARELQRKKKFYADLLSAFQKAKQDELDADADFYEKKWEQAETDRLKTIADAKSKADGQIKEGQRYLALAVQTASLLGQIAAIQTERDQAEIANQRALVDEKLKAGAITEKAAIAERAKLDKLEKKYRYEAAVREKKAASFQAVLAIPQAFLQGLTSAAPPYGAILGAIAAALAAAQAAIIISKPIPKFFRGKKDNYAGPGMVADMGSELVERDGRMFLYTKPTQTYLGATDKVYTAAETKQILHKTNINTTVQKQPATEFDYDKFGKAIPASSININIDKDFISESVANGLSRNNYMDRRYSSR